jgi:hypothetical protein
VSRGFIARIARAQSGAAFPGCREERHPGYERKSAEWAWPLTPTLSPPRPPRDVNVAGTLAGGERESTEHVAPLKHQIYETHGLSIVMAGLVPAIHGLAAARRGCARQARA